MNPTDAERIAKKLIREHAPGWRFKWSPRAVRQFGLCEFGPQSLSGTYLTRTIHLSRPLTLVNDQPMVEWVVKHEIAHALAGPEANHGPVWRAHARRLGIKASRCWTNSGADAKPVRIEGKYRGTCPTCGWSNTQHRLSWSAYNRDCCTPCFKTKGEYVRLVWSHTSGKPITPPKKPAPRRHKRRIRSY